MCELLTDAFFSLGVVQHPDELIALSEAQVVATDGVSADHGDRVQRSFWSEKATEAAFLYRLLMHLTRPLSKRASEQVLVDHSRFTNEGGVDIHIDIPLENEVDSDTHQSNAEERA